MKYKIIKGTTTLGWDKDVKWEFEAEIDCTKEEIEETAKRTAFECVDWGYRVEEVTDDEKNT